MIGTKHRRVCCTSNKHIRVCPLFRRFYCQTHTRLLFRNQTHTRLLVYVNVANTTHTHSTHIPHTYAFVPLRVANTYAFVSLGHQTHTRLSFLGTKHIRVWMIFLRVTANTSACVVKIEKTCQKIRKTTRPTQKQAVLLFSVPAAGFQVSSPPCPPASRPPGEPPPSPALQRR